MIILSDTFDSYTGHALPPWANATPSTGAGTLSGWCTTGAEDGVSAVSNPNMVQCPANATGTLYWLATDVTDGDAGDITVSCYVNSYLGAAGNPGRVGVFARGSDSPMLATSSAYVAWINFNLGAPGLSKVVSGSETTLVDLNPPTGDTIIAWALLTLQLSGTSPTTCTVTAQDLGTGRYYNSAGSWQSSPTNCITYSDSSSPITGAGYGGLFMVTPSNPAIGFWDNFTLGNAAATPPSNPPVIVPIPFGFFPAFQF